MKGLGRGVEHRYRKLYEEDLNPFTAFLQQEAAAQEQQEARAEAYRRAAKRVDIHEKAHGAVMHGEPLAFRILQTLGDLVEARRFVGLDHALGTGLDARRHAVIGDVGDRGRARLRWLDWLGRRFWWRNGGVYLLVARKRAAMMRPLPATAGFSRQQGPTVVSVPVARWRQQRNTE